MVEIFHKNKKVASFLQDNRNFIINYDDFNIKNSISLSLPNSKKIYLYEYNFPPFLESFLPEGYLYEIFKQLLSKEYGRVDEYLIFNLLSSDIQNRISFKSTLKDKLDFPSFEIDEILNNDSSDTFDNLLQTFLNKNAISGVQPKTLALLKEKQNLESKEYIIKTWGDEFRDLALNEYFCLMAVKRAGVKTANVKLSKNNKFLIVEKFNIQDGEFLGFEEILSLMGKNRESKYSGSYEHVAKVIYKFTTNKKESMRAYYKTVVMNYLLKNGDAHLKNFGLLFSDDFSSIFYSPVYDVVNTVVYIHKVKPALMLNGKKVWWSRDVLVEFGQKNCLLSKTEAHSFYDECEEALRFIIDEVQSYINKNSNCKIAKMMCESWKLSLQDKTLKELDNDTIRAWKNH